MKDISELPKAFDKYIDTLKKSIIEAQQYATESMLQESKDRIEIPEEARNTHQFITYQNSLQMKDAELNGSEISSSVFSDLKVGGDDPKWADVPVGAFLEWGTGPLGQESNLYEHGYDYTTISPWDYHTWLQYQQTGNWGIIARPHLYPSFIHTQPILKEQIKEAIEYSWKK